MQEDQVFSGENVDEAVAVGLAALGLTREQVQVEVLDEGSRGLLGIGARPAVVRLTPISTPTPEPPSPPASVVEEEAEEPGPVEVAQAVLQELLAKMDFPSAKIQIRHVQPAAGEEEAPFILDISGTGVDALIGRKGETLAALQRIVRLIVGRQLSPQANLVVDVNGFKRRRERNLRRLAERMAEKAVRNGRTVALEPMPPYERRIVHLALRDRPDVRTESVGTGRSRRVTIIPHHRRE